MSRRERYCTTTSLLLVCLVLLICPVATLGAEPQAFQLPDAVFQEGMPSVYLRGPVEPAKNVILLICDGTGINLRTIARVASGGPNYRLPSERVFEVGLANTHSLSSLVTDSAAASTQIATGYWVPNGTVSVDASGQPLKTILELAKGLGKSTGVITTDQITGGTPSGFVAHVPDREMKSEIARLFAESGSADVVIGGGRNQFLPHNAGGEREDGRDLLSEASARGVAVIDDVDGLKADGSAKVLALINSKSVRSASKRDYTLGDLASEAIRRLSTNPEGFFLMVEGDRIDGAGHRNDITQAVSELLDFETAVEQCVEYAKGRNDTLVIVVSDHETGGVAITNGSAAGTEVELDWIHGEHTGSPVAVYSYGPNSYLLGGHIYLADISKIVSLSWGVQDFGPERAFEGPGAISTATQIH